MMFLTRNRVLSAAAVVAAVVVAGPVFGHDEGAPIPVPAPQAVQPVYLEAEDLLPALESFEAPGTRAEGIAIARRANVGATFSGNAGVELVNVDVGTRMTLRFELPASGTYDIAARMGVGPTYGIVQPAIDGRPLGQPIDGYAAAPGRSEEIVVGRVELAQGSHTVTFTVAGKADAASGLGAGVDYLELVPAADAEHGHDG